MTLEELKQQIGFCNTAVNRDLAYRISDLSQSGAVIRLELQEIDCSTHSQKRFEYQLIFRAEL